MFIIVERILLNSLLDLFVMHNRRVIFLTLNELRVKHLNHIVCVWFKFIGK